MGGVWGGGGVGGGGVLMLRVAVERCLFSCGYSYRRALVAVCDEDVKVSGVQGPANTSHDVTTDKALLTSTWAV